MSAGLITTCSNQSPANHFSLILASVNPMTGALGSSSVLHWVADAMGFASSQMWTVNVVVPLLGGDISRGLTLPSLRVGNICYERTMHARPSDLEEFSPPQPFTRGQTGGLPARAKMMRLARDPGFAIRVPRDDR
ncbi:MAG: hypothetical protein AB7F50_11980 [Fimbriimonadaceae bacterium]